MKSLKIKHLILIEEAHIVFGPGLNILTGETGSGKSAIFSAIRLIQGARADAGCIRTGADLAIVEAEFEGPLFIRREIHRSGKNRCFINDEQVSLSDLKEAVLIDMVDQSSTAIVLSKQTQMLDTFARLLEKVAEFEKSHSLEKEKKERRKTLLQTPKERELEWAQKDLEKMEEANWAPGIEEKLAEEHHLLTSSQQLGEKMSALSFGLNESGEISALKRQLYLLEQCIRLDPQLAPFSQSMKGALVELEEVGRSIQNYVDKLEIDPKRLEEIEKQIGAIESLKRRFGSQIEEAKRSLERKIEELNHLEEEVETLGLEIAQLQKENDALAQSILQTRKELAPLFASLVVEELKSLNLPQAQFEIRVGNTLSEVTFYFSANLGIPLVKVEECASGGELSRLLFAIKTILSDGKSTLVFDEIDSNVGGHTAAILGQKLQELSRKRQVICVTHFVQVAKCALDHFLVEKKEKNGSSLTIVEKISGKKRELEYQRMLGVV